MIDERQRRDRMLRDGVTRRNLLRSGGVAATGLLLGRSLVGSTSAQGADGGEWNQYQGDSGNTGYAPSIEPPTKGAREAWSLEVGGAPVGSPMVDGETVYAAAEDGTVYAYALADGEQQWVFDTDREGIVEPAAGDGTVYVATDRTVFAIDAADGSRRWERQVDDEISLVENIAVGDDGTVYANGFENLVALDGENGDHRWTFENVGTVTAPVISDGTVYVVGEKLYALDEAGEPRWETDALFADAFRQDMDVSNGRIYVADSSARSIYAFDATEGTVQWSVEPDDDLRNGTLTASEDGIFVGAIGVDTERLISFAPADGTVRWERELAAPAFRTERLEDTLYVTAVPTEGGTLTAFAAGDGTQLWTADRSVRWEPSVSGDGVFVGTSAGTVERLDGSDGEVVWSRATGGEIVSTPVVEGEAVFAGGNDSTIHAVERSSGTKQWKFDTERPVEDLAVVDGTVFAIERGGTVRAVDAADGSEEWSYATDAVSAPRLLVAEGTVYVNTSRVIHAVGMDSGEQQWRVSIGGYDRSPAYADGWLFVTTTGDSTIRCLDAATGEEQWSRALGDASQVSSPVVADGIVFVTVGGTVFALETDDGTVRWEEQFDSREAAIAVGPESVFVGYSDGVVALDRVDGTRTWESEAASYADEIPPVVYEEYVLLGSQLGTSQIHAIDRESSEEVWSYETNEPLSSGLGVADGHVYLPDVEGRLVALEEPRPPEATFTTEPAEPVTGETVTFDASDSSDPDGSINRFRWDLDGNGNFGPVGVQQETTYEEPGEYTVALEVRDSQGLTKTAEETITVSERETETPTETPEETTTEEETEQTESEETTAGSSDQSSAEMTDSETSSRDGTESTTSTSTATTSTDGTEAETTNASGPGFGVLGAIGGLASGAYALVGKTAPSDGQRGDDPPQ